MDVQEDVIYKCLKKSNQPRQSGQVCHWTGSLYDYVPHLHSKHSESCFKIDRNKSLYWKIPANGCTDKGLFLYKSQPYLFEIRYDRGDDQSLLFSLIHTTGETKNYSFCLCHKLRPELCNVQRTDLLGTLLVPIQHRSTTIAIPQHVLDRYRDELDRLKFKIVFDQ